MATLDDVRRIALPQTSEGEDRLGFGVLNKGKLKGLAWAWNERVEPGKLTVMKCGCSTSPAGVAERGPAWWESADRAGVPGPSNIRI